jgi:hypothetical protein
LVYGRYGIFSDANLFPALVNSGSDNRST